MKNGKVMPTRFHPNGKPRQSRRLGAALFLVFLVITSLSIFGGILIVLVINRAEMAQLEIDRSKAFFLAEAGLAQSIHELKTQEDLDGDGVGNIASRNLGDGNFRVLHFSSTGEIRSTGTVNHVSRTLQIKYISN